MRLLLVLALLLGSGILSADPVWVLKSGPTAVKAIPLDPVQPVSAWRAQYTDGSEVLWLYATQSPQFYPPSQPEVFRVETTPWTVVVFFPDSWKAAARQTWMDLWTKEFLTLSSLPDPGYPILFPSILRKG